MTQMRAVLNVYLARSYAGTVVVFLLSLSTVIALFDAIELIRKTSKMEVLDFSLVGTLTLLKIPGNILMIAPFAILFAAIFTLSSLARRQELVVMRSAGASLWQLLMPFFVVAFFAGFVLVTIMNPLSATTEMKYQQYEERYLRKEQHIISLLDQGLWLRQGQEDDYILMHAQKVQLPDWVLDDVFVLFFNQDHEFLKRIDAPRARLNGSKWYFEKAILNKRGQLPEALPDFYIPTDLTREEIENSFATPETVSFWAMPAFIRLISSTGLPVTGLQIHFGALLMLPFLCAALVTIAAAVTIRPPRSAGQLKMAVLGILLGFIVFFLTNFLHALGSSTQIPIFLAITAPAMLTFGGGIMALLTLEDQ